MINPFRKIFTPDRVINQIQDNINNTLNSFIKNELLDGIMVEASFSGVTTLAVDHKLGRQPIGWIVVGKTAKTDVWVTSITAKTLTVNVETDVNLDLFIF